MCAALTAELRTKLAIKDCEEELGMQVAGNAQLEEMLAYLHQICLAHATLDETKFRGELPIV